MSASSTGRRRGSQPTTCPTWCVGQHEATDDLHRSFARGWTASTSAGVVQVAAEQYIDENPSSTGHPVTICVSGVESPHQDMLELQLEDAEMLMHAIRLTLSDVAGVEVRA